MDIYSPSPCGRGLGGGGSHSQALLSDNFQHSLDILRLLPAKFDTLNLAVLQATPKQKFNISSVISQISGKSLKGMAWFHDSCPHPLTPSRQGRGDFLNLHKRPNSRPPFFKGGSVRLHLVGLTSAAMFAPPIPLPASPLKGEEFNIPSLSRGGLGWGWGNECCTIVAMQQS